MIVRKQHDTDDKSGLAAHGNEQHNKNDGYRLGQIEDEVISGSSHRIRLEVDLVNFDADRQIAFEFFEFLSYSIAHRHDVASLHRGDPQADGGLPS